MSTKQIWHMQTIQQVCDTLQVTSDSWLFETEIINRRSKSGLNELIEYGLKNPWHILVDQFRKTTIVVLIIAAIISAILSDWKDAVATAVIVVINTALGFTQEYRAERAMIALKQMGNALTIRLERESLFKQGTFSNKLLWAAVIFAFILQMGITYWESAQARFGSLSLPPFELAISLGLSTVVFGAVEIEKWFKRHNNPGER
ncbi:MAG: cation-translocating P-type ATPase [Chloroflexi bacterium]|nr:cation-translocating P-type ATPase [Chloroflexota bacterium]